MKMVVADLDGTLFHKQQISESTINTVKDLKNSGNFFTLATGRHMNATRKIATQLKITLPVICSNGAIIYDFQKEEMILKITITDSIVMKVITLCEERELDYFLWTADDIYSTSKGFEKYKKRVGFDVRVLEKNTLKNHRSDGILKILVIEDNQEILDELKEKLEAFSELSFAQSQPSFLDIGHQKASKGIALEILSLKLGIDLKDCIAVGDQENDIPMIEVAGVGVAMGNGNRYLLHKADFITKTFEEEGFTHAMKVLVL